MAGALSPSTGAATTGVLELSHVAIGARKVTGAGIGSTAGDVIGVTGIDIDGVADAEDAPDVVEAAGVTPRLPNDPINVATCCSNAATCCGNPASNAAIFPNKVFSITVTLCGRVFSISDNLTCNLFNILLQ